MFTAERFAAVRARQATRSSVDEPMRVKLPGKPWRNGSTWTPSTQRIGTH